MNEQRLTDVDAEAALRELRHEWERLTSMGVDPAFIARGGALPQQNRTRVLRALSSTVTKALFAHEALSHDEHVIHGWARDQYARTRDPSLLAFWRSASPLLPGLLAREFHERASFIRRQLLKLDNKFGIERLCGLRHPSDEAERSAASWLWDLYPLVGDTLDLIDCGIAKDLFEPHAVLTPEIQWVEEYLRPLSDRLGVTFDAVFDVEDDLVSALIARTRWREIPFDLGFGLREIMLPRKERRGLPATKVRKLLEWSVNYWEDRIDDFLGPEEYGDVKRWAWEETRAFLESDETWQVIGSAFFRPKQWVDNFRALRPVITTSALPPEVRRRTNEIFESFIVGNCISALLLCRGVLEFVLIDRGEAMGISIYEGKVRSRSNIRKLEYLVADAKEKLPSLGEAMEEIRKKGNAYAHPRRKKGEVSEEEIEILRKEVLGILGYLKLFLEGIYGRGLGGRA